MSGKFSFFSETPDHGGVPRNDTVEGIQTTTSSIGIGKYKDHESGTTSEKRRLICQAKSKI